MDHTAAMLEIAKERLGDRAKLFEADIISMSIPEEFDFAISNGGLCAFVDTGSEWDFYIHLTDEESNVRALQNIANCLHKGGLFIINIQGVHHNHDRSLPGEIVYSQEIKEKQLKPFSIKQVFDWKKKTKADSFLFTLKIRDIL